MRCFVSAPASIDTGPVTKILEMEGVQALDARSLPLAASFTEAVSELIRTADLAIFLLPDTGSDPPSLLLEIGLALGMGKQVLVFVPRGRRTPPALSGLLTVRADPDDVDAIRLQVRAALLGARIPKSKPSQAAPTEAQPGVGAWLFAQLSEFSHSPGAGTERRLEEIVAELFRQAGGQVETSRAPESGPDLAVSLGDEGPVPGALLVEVKVVRGRRPVLNAMTQLQDYVIDRGASLGVVIYWGPSGIDSPSITVPLVVALDLADLPHRLEGESLAGVIAAERNLAIHGM